MSEVAFYLGTHQPAWLTRVRVPLFVSHRRLDRYKRLPRARCRWALDSGAFTELGRHGQWTESPDTYVSAVCRYRDEVGRLAWAAPQDWLCEPFVRARTGLSVREHLERSVENCLLCYHSPSITRSIKPPRLRAYLPKVGYWLSL
ncbi:DUF7221 family queuine tRNA-ribosyltransferase-like protein [Actinocorallia aurantiaca]|uniref:DeoxyPurine in DNA protein A domain-containing protein n=1 Tax=Actinocorallia aurantiaca TaxID=46204 RepID=A0ABN3UJI4_9ACTN